jgi:hypothetical protein
VSPIKGTVAADTATVPSGEERLFDEPRRAVDAESHRAVVVEEDTDAVPEGTIHARRLEQIGHYTPPW